MRLNGHEVKRDEVKCVCSKLIGNVYVHNNMCDCTLVFSVLLIIFRVIPEGRRELLVVL